jgi:hypothetical protein
MIATAIARHTTTANTAVTITGNVATVVGVDPAGAFVTIAVIISVVGVVGAGVVVGVVGAGVVA